MVRSVSFAKTRGKKRSKSPMGYKRPPPVRFPEDPRQLLIDRSRIRARAKGAIYLIDVNDITMPLTCKYLGIPLDWGPASMRTTVGPRPRINAPSIDRIDSTLGYIPGNVQVISYLANVMKSTATVEQLRAFAKGIISVHGI